MGARAEPAADTEEVRRSMTELETSDFDDLLSWPARRAVYLEWLTAEGYRPEIDEDGDVRFKSEGFLMFVMSSTDPTYLQLLLPNFWSIDDASERAAAHVSANEVNRNLKVAKVFQNEAADDVSATVEMFVSDPREAIPHLARCLRVLATAVAMFRRGMMPPEGS